jgi:hypothetical protein
LGIAKARPKNRIMKPEEKARVKIDQMFEDA